MLFKTSIFSTKLSTGQYFFRSRNSDISVKYTTNERAVVRKSPHEYKLPGGKTPGFGLSDRIVSNRWGGTATDTNCRARRIDYTAIDIKPCDAMRTL